MSARSAKTTVSMSPPAVRHGRRSNESEALIRTSGRAAPAVRAYCWPATNRRFCLDRKWATFMYSYPNWIPFDEPTVRRITASLEPLEFDRLYGAFGRNILNGAKEVIARSELRYLTAIGAARS